MNPFIKQIQIFDNLGRAELEEALLSIQPYKNALEIKLKENPDDNALLDKIIELNRTIESSNILLNCKFGEFHKLYSKLESDFTDENGNLNEKGVKRLIFLDKKHKELDN